MSSTRSSDQETERELECLHFDSDDEEETPTCISCGLIGFKRNQVFDCSLSNSEIGEEDSEELFEINLTKEPLDAIREDCESTVFSLDIQNWIEEDVVYVAVGHDGDSSMEALSWALKHAVTPSSTLYLVHVFPEIKLIPSPLGKIPRSHVNLEYINYHLNQKKGKIKLLLQKFIDLCVDSKANKVETILMEGDNIAEAIVELVGKHDIRKLVIGTTRSNLRKSGSRRRNGTANKVLKSAQERCDVRIICEGREVTDQMIGYNSSSSRYKDSTRSQVGDERRGHVPLMRFMTYPMWLFRPRLLSPR